MQQQDNNIAGREPYKNQDVIETGGLRLSAKEKKAFYEGKEIILTSREAKLLEFLMRNENKIIERKQILDYVWGEAFNPFSNVVDVHIKNLRHKLKDKKEKPLIETIWGSGYRLRISDGSSPGNKTSPPSV